MSSRATRVKRVFVGVIPVFTKKLILADPATLECFVSDKRRRGKRKRDFSYSGACVAAEQKRRAAVLVDGADEPVAVVTAAPKNQNYPVYALVKDGKIVRLVVVFDGDPCRERESRTGVKRRRRRS